MRSGAAPAPPRSRAAAPSRRGGRWTRPGCRPARGRPRRSARRGAGAGRRRSSTSSGAGSGCAARARRCAGRPRGRRRRPPRRPTGRRPPSPRSPAPPGPGFGSRARPGPPAAPRSPTAGARRAAGSPAPDRRALLEERRDALLGVVRDRVAAHHAAGVAVGLLQRQAEVLVHRPLADGQRLAARRRDPGGEPRPPRSPGARAGPPGSPGPRRAPRGRRSARRSAASPWRACAPRRGPPRPSGVVQKRPILTPGVAKWADSAATAMSQAATSWQPAAVAMPCTARDHRLRRPWIVSISSAQRGEDALVDGRVARRELAQVVARAEDGALGAEHHRPHRGVVAGLPQPPRQLGHRLERQGVAALGAAEHEGRDRPLARTRTPAGRSPRRRAPRPRCSWAMPEPYPDTVRRMQIHLVDGTYELFRHHLGLPPEVAATSRAAGHARGDALGAGADRRRARPTSAWPPTRSSSRSATTSGPATRAAPGSSRRCWPSSRCWSRPCARSA